MNESSAEADPSFVDLRDATPEDMETILKMMEAFNQEEGIAFTRESLEENLVALSSNADWGVVLLGEVGGVPASYAVLTYGFDFEFGGREAFLTELYVAPKYRRRGVGGTTLRAIEDRCRRDALGAIHLIVRPENGEAQVLYRRHDFRFDPRMMMTKALEPN
jgi:ribosomal protein S18 acetylase RimI-like enzyme